MKKHGTWSYRIWLVVLLLLLLAGVLLLVFGQKSMPGALVLPKQYSWGDAWNNAVLSGRLF